MVEGLVQRSAGGLHLVDRPPTSVKPSTRTEILEDGFCNLVDHRRRRLPLVQFGPDVPASLPTEEESRYMSPRAVAGSAKPPYSSRKGRPSRWDHPPQPDQARQLTSGLPSRSGYWARPPSGPRPTAPVPAPERHASALLPGLSSIWNWCFRIDALDIVISRLHGLIKVVLNPPSVLPEALVEEVASLRNIPPLKPSVPMLAPDQRPHWLSSRSCSNALSRIACCSRSGRLRCPLPVGGSGQTRQAG